MKPKPNRSLSLSWTSQREKASGNHLLPRKQATSLTSPIYAVYITISLCNFVFPGVLSQFFDLTDRVVVNDTLPKSTSTSLHMSTREQKSTGKQQHIYERKSHKTKMADFVLQVVRTQALDLSSTNIRLSSPPSSKNRSEDD